MRIYDGRESFYQWDLNQKITSNAFEVGDEIHFFNIRQTDALVVKAYKLDGVVVADVPNILLQVSQPITAWKYVYDEDSAQTVMEHTFKVNQRAKPSDYIYTETELYELRKEVADAVSKLDGVAEAEDERVTNETDRQVAEVERENAEEDRVDAEAVRASNETARKSAETKRVNAEQSRVEAETNRASSEQERIAAEEVRQANFESLPNNIGNAIKGSASGEVVRVNDVSPIEHTAKVKVSGENIDPATVTLTVQDASGENVATYTPSENGTVNVASLSPTMVLSTDTEGVNIDLEYNQDTNKAIGNVREDINELDRVTAELADKIENGGGGSITVDDHLDINSTNPVQNKVVSENLRDHQTQIDTFNGRYNNVIVPRVEKCETDVATAISTAQDAMNEVSALDQQIDQTVMPKLTDLETAIGDNNTAISEINATIGDIDTALDVIIAMQQTFIGGDGE